MNTVINDNLPADNYPEFLYLHLYGRTGEEGRVWGGKKLSSLGFARLVNVATRQNYKEQRV